MIQIKKIKGLDGTNLDLTPYSKIDNGRHGKAVDQVINNILTDIYNLNSGIDIPSLNLEVKSCRMNRKQKSYTTWIKITDNEVGMFYWQLSDEKQQKLTADRLFVNIDGSIIDSHKVIRYNKHQQELFRFRFDQLSKKLKRTGYKSVSFNGFILEKKSNKVVEFRINNARLQRINCVTHTTFNSLFETEIES